MLWSRNLQLHYPFENQANDYSGNARHGTVFGSGVYATRPNAGRCLYFDGTGDYVATPSFGLSGTVVVFACDIRCNTSTLVQDILADGSVSGPDGIPGLLRLNSTADLHWYYFEPALIPATAPDYFAAPFNNAWVHLFILADYAGKKVYFYRAGIPFGSPVTMTGTPAFPSTARVKYIGSYNTSYQMLTAGYLQNVQLWTLPTMPPLAAMTANVNRIMLGLNPIWSV